MKKNDIATLVLIISISFMIAWFTASAIIPAPKKEDQKVDDVVKIESDVAERDKRIFNPEAINPTIDRSIGKSADKLPFSSNENN
jgi:hypothetical protein